MRRSSAPHWIGAVAVALGFGAGLAAATPTAGADTGRGSAEAGSSAEAPQPPASRNPATPRRPGAATRAQRTAAVGPARRAAKDVDAAVQNARPPTQVTQTQAKTVATQPVMPSSALAADAGPAPVALSRPQPSAAAAPSAGTDIPAAAVPAAPAVPAAATQPRLWLSPTWQGVYRLRSESTGAAELSGITYAGGSTFYAVGDTGTPRIWQLAATISATFGWVTSGLVTGGINTPGMGRDSEGIALRPGRDSVWVSDEISSTITEFSLSDGRKLGSVEVPEIYRPANVQDNLGLESLSYGAAKLWTANEEALKPDGSISTTRNGSWVRIQQFGGEGLTPATQYAYRTDRISGMSPFIAVERSGLVDLLALPDGRVLALEREVGGFFPLFRSRVYQIDFSGATDVSDVASLANGGFIAVGKRLLWQGFFLSDNFEGMTLGPKLNDGAYSLVLISDNGSGGSGQRQDLYSLVLRGVQDPTQVPAAVLV
jgi:hypothetical protein